MMDAFEREISSVSGSVYSTSSSAAAAIASESSVDSLVMSQHTECVKKVKEEEISTLPSNLLSIYFFLA